MALRGVTYRLASQKCQLKGRPATQRARECANKTAVFVIQPETCLGRCWNAFRTRFQCEGRCDEGPWCDADPWPVNALVARRSFRLFRYRSCFVASEAVDWLVGANKAADRLQGVQLGRLLQASGYVHHVVDDHDFKDEFLFFRFFCGELAEHVALLKAIAALNRPRLVHTASLEMRAGHSWGESAPIKGQPHRHKRQMHMRHLLNSSQMSLTSILAARQRACFRFER